MTVQLRRVEFYRTAVGNEPFREWLESLKDARTRATIRVKIDRIRLGNFGNCRSVGSGVSELKIDYGRGYRIYFGQHGNELVLLLCGGDKSTQATDIPKAHNYWMDFKKRSHEKAKEF